MSEVDYTPFDRHDLPSGKALYVRKRPGRGYYGEVREKSDGTYSGVRAAQYISASGLCKWWDPEGGYRMLDSVERDPDAWFARRDKRATEGTNVHEKILESLASGEGIPSLADVSPDERGYGQAVISWWATRKPEVIAAEFVVCSDTWHYAGRVDLLAVIDGQRTLLDLKTGFIGKSQHAQLGLYRLAAEESGYGPIDRTLLLKVTEDGKHHELDGLLPPEQIESGLRFRMGLKPYESMVSKQVKEMAA